MIRKLFCLISFAVLLCAVSSANAAVLEITPDAPVPGDLDISNFVGALTDADNVGTEDDSNNPPYWNDWCTYVAHDRGGQGQTFVTGDSDVVMTGVWVKHVTYSGADPDQTWYRMQAGAELELRVTDPAAAGTDAFVLSSETYVVTGAEENALPADTTNDQTGTSLWIHITLDEPVALVANTEYGFDLTSLSGKAGIMFFETDGINDRAAGGNPYEAGTAYTSGVNPDDHGDDLNGANDNNMVVAPGDHVFVVELEAAPATGPTVIWVSDNTGGDRTDQDWIDLLVEEGYDVNLDFSNQEARSLEEGEIEALNAADLIIISRDTNSGDYDDGDEPTQWNAVTTPIIMQVAHIARSSRWRWLDTADAIDEQTVLEAVIPEHPIFKGVSLDPNNQIDILTTVASFPGTIDPGNGTLIAKSDAYIWIVEWEQGQEFYSGSGQIAGGNRLLFVSGGTPEPLDGVLNLTEEGVTMFLNAVKYMIPIVPANPGTDGLVAHYAFENDTTDSSGNGLDGTIIGDATFVEGVKGMALDFSGDDYVDCGGAAEFSFTDAMTVSTWVNIRSRPVAWMAMIAKGENAWRLGVNNETTGVHYAFTGSARGWQAANTATELNFDQWYHIAATYDTEAGATVYINGKPDASNPDTGGIVTNEFSLLLGENPEATGRLFDGMLDEIKIYDRALSEGEILFLAGQRVNLALNPSFEEDEVILDDPDWYSWATWNPAEGAGSNATIVDTEAVDGARSLLIEPIGPENWHFIVVGMPIPTEVGTSYTTSFWAKAVEARPLGAQWKAVDNSESWGYADFELTTEWAEYSLTAEALNAETKLEFFCAASEVSFLLDAVSVTEE